MKCLKKVLQKIRFPKKKEKEIKPIIFQNKPITSEEKDLFDYSYQKQVLESAIENDARIIGIVGDYGTGKSSITKLLEKSRKKKLDTIVNINLWGQFSEDFKDNNSLIKSFLFQLAYANKRRNRHFAQYINARFNKNNGKIGFSIATRKIFFLLFLAAIFILLFFTFNSITISVPSITDKDKFLNASLWEQILAVLSYGRYILLVIGFSFVTWAAGLAAPTFTTWKSEGNYTPDNSDVYEVYLRIIKRLTSLPAPMLFRWIIRKIINKKFIIFVDDLDRTSNKSIVVEFLKEIYKYLHLLPDSLQQQLVFIISLKSESLLKLSDTNIDESDRSNIYSKIFDYTLSIKQIHNENYRDIVENLLEQEKQAIIALNKKCNNEITNENNLIKKVVAELKWIYFDENLTIREIKERLNETFLLYQTLLHRNYENPSIQLQKCAAVVYLKRKYSEEYDELLTKEKEFAKLIRECNKVMDENEKEKIFSENFEELTIPNDLKHMIFSGDIEDDFSMYLYNYPKNSYVKNSKEKELFDALVHDDESFINKEDSDEIIREIIEKKNGKVIDEAFDKYLQETLPEIIFHNESLFCYTIKRFERKQLLVIEMIKQEVTDFLSDISKPLDHLDMALSFDTSVTFKKQLASRVVSQIKELLLRLSLDDIEIIRKRLIEVLQDNVKYLISLYIEETLPQISMNTFDYITSEEIKILILQSFSDNQIQSFDKHIIDISSKTLENILLKRKCIISILLHHVDNNTLDSFDFTDDWIPEKLISISRGLYELIPDNFIDIRKAAKQKIQKTPDDFYILYNGPYPLITKDELNLLKLEELNSYINFRRIALDNCIMLSDYCNLHNLQKDDLYNYFEALFLKEEHCITDKQVINSIFENINFNTIHFSSLSLEQQNSLINKLGSAFELDTVQGSFKFMQTIKTLLEELEKEHKNLIISDDSVFNDYLALLNNVKQITETSYSIIKDKWITIPLEPVITDFLFYKKCYIRYIVGKTLFDKKLTKNKTIPLDRYYKAYVYSEECFDYFMQNEEIIKKFYSDKMYLKEKTPIEKLKVWYSWRQPLDLIETILSTLKDKPEMQKEYLKQISHIDTESDAHDFINLITKDEYINLLKDETVFYYLWEKMWNQNQKAQLTKKVNGKLGTKYHFGDMKSFIHISKINKKKK